MGPNAQSVNPPRRGRARYSRTTARLQVARVSKEREPDEQDKARGDRLRALRLAMGEGFTHAKVAKLGGFSEPDGSGRIQISRLESGHLKFTSRAQQDGLAKAYGVETGALVEYARGARDIKDLLASRRADWRTLSPSAAFVIEAKIARLAGVPDELLDLVASTHTVEELAAMTREAARAEIDAVREAFEHHRRDAVQPRERRPSELQLGPDETAISAAPSGTRKRADDTVRPHHRKKMG